jgi:hypothetical protein
MPAAGQTSFKIDANLAKEIIWHHKIRVIFLIRLAVLPSCRTSQESILNALYTELVFKYSIFTFIQEYCEYIGCKSHEGKEESRLLECDAVCLLWESTFRRNISPPLSG